MKITVSTIAHAPLDEVWRAYTTPEDIKQWNAASSDWHTTSASVDLRPGGKFSSRMEAKDGSFGFDFAGVYTRVVPHQLIEYALGDRMVVAEFAKVTDGVTVTVTFDGETTHSEEQQRAGWQAILDNFAHHVKARQGGTNMTGSFIWYELMSANPDAAAKFYGAVVGWKIPAQPHPLPDGKDYRMIARDDGGSAGGMLKLSPEMLQHGARPCWLGYLHVADVDATCKAIVADGGKVLMGSMDLPVGQIAMVADPMGTPFYVMAPLPPPGKPDAKSDVFDVRAEQRARWNELASPDLARAKAFYARHFGFQFNEVMPMGPMGDYCFIDHDGVRLGAIMQKQDPGPMAAWLFYFGVPSVAAAQRAIEAGGGRITQGPHQVPGGDWIIVGTDPEGCAFGVVGPRGE